MAAKVIVLRAEETWDQLDVAAEILADGGLVAFPTETVYGLGGNALCAETVEKIYTAKGRPSDNPLIVHVAKREDVYRLAESVPETAEKILDHLCPGPITFILYKSDLVPDAVTAGGKTVAIRFPEHPIAKRLIEKSGVPVAAPSANLSGRPSPTKASHVIEDLKDRIDCIIDGGDCRVGLESTVIDLTAVPPRILRPGGVSQETLSALLGEVEGYAPKDTDENAPKSPGMKYQHYAPRGKMMVFEGKNCRAAVREKLLEIGTKNVCILAAGEADYEGVRVINCGETPEEYSKRLFDALRNADSLGAEIIFAELPFLERGGITTALKNRIYKSCGGNVTVCE